MIEQANQRPGASPTGRARDRSRPRAVGPMVLGWCGLVIGCTDDGGPRLDTATPGSASRSTTVTLTGSRLCGAAGDCATAGGEITIGLALPMVRAVITSYTDTSAQIVIPPATPLGATVLLVTVNERTSNGLDFEVLP